MKKLLLLPYLASLVLFANSSPFSMENPYENISTIENKQIIGDNFVEVYENQNNIKRPDFSLFELLEYEEINNTLDECEIDPLTGECYPTDIPLPSPIDQYKYILILIGIAIISKRRFY